MKKIVTSLFVLCLLSQTAFSQNRKVRPTSLGVSFILNDFTTAQRIRSGSFEQVTRENRWAEFRDMGPGLQVTYFKGLSPHVDFAGNLGGSIVNYPLAVKPLVEKDAMLLELDASVNLKMFTDNYWFTPYLTAGVGASKYKARYGAFIPLGGGLKLNLFDEASVFLTASYKVPVTAENTAYHFTYGIGIAGAIGKKR